MTFSNSIAFTVTNNYHKLAVDQIFNSVSGRLKCFFSKSTLKLFFFDIYLTTFLEVRNFGNTLAISVIFCLNMLEIQSRFQKGIKKFRKSFCF